MLMTMFLFSMIGFAQAGAQESADTSGLAEAYFAGGCFWCTEADFEKIPGVKEVVSGYSGGATENPSYEQVSFGDRGHQYTSAVYYQTGIRLSKSTGKRRNR